MTGLQIRAQLEDGDTPIDRKGSSTSHHFVRDQALRSRTFSYGLAFPLAGVVTVGLTLSMAGLIATEFVPQDKSEPQVFAINPVPQDILPSANPIELEPLREVEIPPAAPAIDHDPAQKVTEPPIKLAGRTLDLPDIDLDFGPQDIVVADTDTDPIVRIPPVFPARFSQGDHSGYCQVAFDVGADGRPFNVETTRCTNRSLAASTVKSVQKWKYRPRIQNGRPVSQTGLTTTVRFDLRDERGKVLPLPKGE